MRHGGQILADALAIQGVKRVFSVPGESFLAALDGLYRSGIENVVCRQEGGAAMMAEANGKLTNAPGVLFVTRGPGATNASAGIHVAMHDSTPMVVFIGQIARGHRDRAAFQEVDYKAFLGDIAKAVFEVGETARLPEYVSRAFHTAMSGRPGPVVLALPEDMLSETADVPDLPAIAPAPAAVAPAQVEAVMAALAAAKAPLVVAGGALWTAEASADLARFAEAQGLPVAVSFRRQDYLDNRNQHYVGDLSVGMRPDLKAALAEADLLLLLGTRFGDVASGGYAIDPGAPGTRIVHVHPDPDELGRVFRPDPGIVASAPAMLAALAEQNGPGREEWGPWRSRLRAGYEAWLEPVETPGAVKLERVVAELGRLLPDGATLANGAGNYNMWLHRYHRFTRPKSYLGATSGSMGYGFPAAIAAALETGRLAVAWEGDGCFQMTLNEMSTAVQHGAQVVVIVANNGRYGTIRMHQERAYPGRVSGTDLANPDFAALARAYGGHGEVVVRDEDFAPAFGRAVASGGLAVIELRLDPEALTTTQTLSEVRGD
ncbi:thiamine pyrophosphate-dependent enzyme [Sinisalibacter aestuarii]|uniref:Thiamine pyrophosphate TPP-binding domain-containing protein n=1 Tax=Sinisalibacter aestuarii TaxID=2949426 RepID=A0ABQ5LV57_9RHOB|nr:thiamine pyrophosphate-dependent enzyme [Sinisalibacter aestuarii]GKY88862.1 thiamine pyrophosphate TPP-binding domain-containing protein [Sinisalibacter aestuarii]